MSTKVQVRHMRKCGCRFLEMTDITGLKVQDDDHVVPGGGRREDERHYYYKVLNAH